MPLLPASKSLLDGLEFGEYSGTAGIIAALGKMPVLRPYAKLKILGEGVAKPFIVDDIADPETSKFMYLRTFEYSLMPGPEQTKVTLFDDNGHIREVLTNIYNAVERNKSTANGGQTFMEFEWGWADFNDTVLGVIPIRKNISSAKHKLQIMNVEISYEEGGVAYQIVGFDTMTHMQGIMSKQTFPQCDIRAAITALLLSRGLAAPIFGNADNDSGPRECVQDWRADGNDTLQIVKEWLYKSGGLSERGKPLYVWWDSILNKLHIADVPGAGSFNELLAADLAGPHQVNYWDPNESATGGASIVVKFRPKISGIHQLKSVAQISYLDGDVRMIAETLFSPEAGITAETLSNAPTEVSAGRGAAMHTPTGERMRPVKDLALNIGLAQYADVVNRGLGVNTPGAMNCLAELDCIGWPRADDYTKYMNKFMKLVVRAPYGLNHYVGDDDQLTWVSKGVDTMLSGYYIIKKLTHVIDDTGYRMRIEIARLTSPTDPPLSPVGSPETAPAGGGG